MAMAPMDTVREAVTKALTKPASPWLPVLSRSHSPRRRNRPSMFSTSPTAAPRARESTTSMERPAVRLPLSTRSIPSMAPVMAMNMTHMPLVRARDSCWLGRKRFPARRPATMLALLRRVPSPIIGRVSFL